MSVVARSFLACADTAQAKTEWLTALNKCVVETRAASGVDEDAVIANLAPVWIPDRAATSCQICNATFTMTKRRHHCRMWYVAEPTLCVTRLTDFVCAVGLPVASSAVTRARRHGEGCGILICESRCACAIAASRGRVKAGTPCSTSVCKLSPATSFRMAPPLASVIRTLCVCVAVFVWVGGWGVHAWRRVPCSLACLCVTLRQLREGVLWAAVVRPDTCEEEERPPSMEWLCLPLPHQTASLHRDSTGSVGLGLGGRPLVPGASDVPAW